METPIDIAIRTSSRMGDAPYAKGKKKKKSPSLRVKVLSLVHEANKNVADERRVVPRDALTVMSRALEELSSLPPNSREHGVLREVNRFISLTQRTHPNKEHIKHTDLLAAGNPLSTRNAELTSDEFARRYAAWLSADPKVSDDYRDLVYTAFSLPLRSVKREHAFARLRSLQASAVPSYFRIDHEISALVAAFLDGNSSAARSARVALQWRDRVGRWMEMGRGLNIRLRLGDGNVVSVPGVHVGVDPSRIQGNIRGQESSNEGLVQISGSNYVPDGVYNIPSGAAERVKARLSEETLREAGVSARPVKRKARFNETVVDVADLEKGRLDAPVGWKSINGSDALPEGQASRQGVEFFRSDDDYVVSRSKDGSYALWRTDSNGMVTDKVGEGSNWADVNVLARNDEEDYDRYKQEQEAGELPLEGVEPAPRRVGDVEAQYRLQESRRRAQARAEENRQVEALEKSLEEGKDAAGRDVPSGWEGILNQEGIFAEASWERKLEGGDIRDEDKIIARVSESGDISVGTPSQWYGNDLKSWNETDGAVQEALDSINSRRANAGLPALALAPSEDTSTGAPRLQVHASMVKGTLARQGVNVSDERAKQIRDMIDKEGLVDWSEATDSEIAEAVNDVAPQEGKKAGFPAGTRARVTFSPSIRIPGQDNSRTETYVLQEDGKWRNERTGNVVEELPGGANQKIGAGAWSEPEYELPTASGGLSEKYDQIFKDAAGVPISDKISQDKPYEISVDVDANGNRLADDKDIQLTWGSSVPQGAVVVSMSGGESGETYLLRYPDGTYHVADLSGDQYNSESKNVKVESVEAWGPGILQEIVDPDSMYWAYGETYPSSLQQQLEEKYNAGEFDDLLRSLETSGGASRLSTAYDDVFKNADGVPASSIISADSPREVTVDIDANGNRLPEPKDINVSWDPSVPEGAVIVSESGGESGTTYVLRYPDGTYHIADLSGDQYNSGSQYVKVEPVDAWGTGILGEIIDPNSMYWAYGQTYPSSLQQDLENRFNAGDFENTLRSLETPGGPGEPPTPPAGGSGGGSPEFGKDYGERLVDAANAIQDLWDSIRVNFIDDDSSPNADQGGEDLVDEIFDHYGDQFDLAKDIAGDMNENPNFYNTFDREQFIESVIDAVIPEIEDAFDEAINSVREDGERVPRRANKRVFVESARNRLRSELNDYVDSALNEYRDIYGGGEGGPEEPPTPPSGGGGTPPKAPSPSTPSTPELFKEFDVPAGAFEFNTVDYEPAGREDQESPDYTDNPERLAVRFSLEALVRALTQAVIGDSDSNVIDGIINSNFGDDDDVVSLEDIDDIVNTPVTRASSARGTGAGSLEFRNGEEFIPAEALYNAVFKAGGDPNLVIANAYDAVHGDRRNLSRLFEEAGELPSPQEQKLIDDMTEQIRQIDDALEDGESPVSNKLMGDVEERTFAGELLYNLSVVFPDSSMYTPDNAEYIPSVDEVDENGYTDNPRLLAQMFAESDLLQQFYTGIRDGSGSAFFVFNPESSKYPEEVPVEAVRDALQYRGINTNTLLESIRDEPVEEVQEAAPSSEPEQAPVETPTAAPEPEPTAPTAVYPGPREPGYSRNNTTLDAAGSVIASGYTVYYSPDGSLGTVVSIQNDPEYVRVRFQDGTTKVKSARHLQVMSTEGGNPVTAPARPRPAQRRRAGDIDVDVQRRLEAPIPEAPRLARSGETRGVNVTSSIPDFLTEYANTTASQEDFKEWGLRDAEIARAANDRPTIDSIVKILADARRRRLEGEITSSQEYQEIIDNVEPLIADAFGARDGVSFGAGRYKIKVTEIRANVETYSGVEELERNAGKYSISFNANITDQRGVVLGRAWRTITIDRRLQSDGTIVDQSNVKNEILRIDSTEQKKGFASAFNRYMENWYIANGIKKVKVQAAAGGDWVGGLVWALNGFNFETPRSALSMADALVSSARTDRDKAIAQRLSDRAQEAVRSGDLSDAPTALEMALAGWTPGAAQGDWLGAKVLKRNSWYGTKSLLPTSKEQVQSANYNQVKNAEVRVNAGQNRPELSSAAVSYIMGNDFQESVVPYMVAIDEVREVLRNNDSLARLSPETKSQLQRFVANETLNKDSKMPVEDLSRLREVLFNEYQADYGYAADAQFAVGDVLTRLAEDELELTNQDIKNLGFTLRELDYDEAGVNSTWMFIHSSGQRFFLKIDDRSPDYGLDTFGAEIDATTLMRAGGIVGVHDTRASSAIANTIIMSEAGSSLPSTGRPVQGREVFSSGIDTKSDGSESLEINSYEDLLQNMVDPTDVIRMMILDGVGGYYDRHTGNWLASYDTVSKGVRIFPVDNTFYDFKEDIGSFIMSEIRDNELYSSAINFFVSKMGGDRSLEMLQEEAKRVVNNINNELYQPSGDKLDSIVSRYGSFDNFKRLVLERIDSLIADPRVVDYFTSGVR